MHALKRHLWSQCSRTFKQQHHCAFGLLLQHRYVFGFSPTPSIPKGIENFELLYREVEKESENARKFLKDNGYIDMVSLRNIDNYPLNIDELRALRIKLQQPLHVWTEPPLWEDNNSTQHSIDLMLNQLIESQKSSKKQSKRSFYIDINEDDNSKNANDEYRILTPIFYNKKDERAILARPADKLITILKPSKNKINQVSYGDKENKYELSGNQWHKEGARYYDKDDGLSWDHIDIDDYQKKINAWDEREYVNQNVDWDPNSQPEFWDDIRSRRKPMNPQKKS